VLDLQTTGPVDCRRLLLDIRCIRDRTCRPIGPYALEEPSQARHKVQVLEKPAVAIHQQDYVLRGLMSETTPTIFWVGADAAAMLDRVACSSGRERMIEDTGGTWQIYIA